MKLLSTQLSPVCYFFPLSSKYHNFSTWSSYILTPGTSFNVREKVLYPNYNFAHFHLYAVRKLTGWQNILNQIVADIFLISSALNFLMNKILNSKLSHTFEVSVTYFNVNLSCILAMTHKHTLNFPYTSLLTRQW